MTDLIQHRPIKLVMGYLKADLEPYGTRNAGLRNRVAIIMDSYRPGHVDPYFDVKLYATLMMAVQRALGGNRMLAAAGSGDATEVKDETELERIAMNQGGPITRVA